MAVSGWATGEGGSVNSRKACSRVLRTVWTLEQAFLELTEPTHAAHARTVPGAGGRAR